MLMGGWIRRALKDTFEALNTHFASAYLNVLCLFLSFLLNISPIPFDSTPSEHIQYPLPDRHHDSPKRYDLPLSKFSKGSRFNTTKPTTHLYLPTHLTNISSK